MPIKFIGRTTDFKGKTLWEILGNLKNFGVGRIVIRSRFQRYPEPCYMKILKVGALPLPEIPNHDRKVAVLVERTFRGLQNPKPVQLDTSSYKADYVLIPKDQEHLFLGSNVPPVEKRILPRTVDFPPLFLEMTMRQMKAKGITDAEKPKLTVHYNKTNMVQKNYKIAEEGEIPTVEANYAVDKSSSLYPETETAEPS